MERTLVGTRTVAENLLQHMAVPAKGAVYQIGCLEQRVTLYSQQVRALNLVFALFDQKRLAAGGRVIVVGGGAAGLTAAVASAALGASVTVLERLDTLLPFQSGNLTRWLHPHIYEWPEPSYRHSDAGLPLMNWAAGYAADVAKSLRESFYRSARDKRLKDETGVRNVKLHPGPGTSQRLEWNESKGRFRSESFDALILAIGFGLERPSSLGPVLSYWRNDDLSQPELDADRKRHYLISGCGDGGLVDLLRIRIREFRHDKMIEEFIGQSVEQKLKDDLLHVEETAHQMAARGEDPSDFLYDEYQRLRPGIVDEQIMGRLRQDTQATLNGPSRFPWNLNTSILNRFLASALIGLKGDTVGADWWRGTLKSITQEAAQCAVHIENEEVRRFDRVILRHGPEPVLGKWLSKADLDPLRARNVLDQTRVPAWPDGYFGEEPAKQAPVERPTRPPRKQTIQISIPGQDKRGMKVFDLDIGTYGISTFQDLVDVVFAALKKIPAFTYGKTWRLRNLQTGQKLTHIRERNEKKLFGQPVADPRPLDQAGVLPGDVLEVVFLTE